VDSAPSSGEKPAATSIGRRTSLGVPFLLLLLYPAFDYGRPANPMGIPMIIAALLFVAWIFAPAKKMNLHVVCFFLLLGEMSIGVVTASNNFAAYIATEGMTLILLCTCIPLIQFVDSLRKIRIFVNVLVLVFIYVGVWAILSEGRGPGWQDENYAAAMMCIAVPLAYFSIPLSERRAVKVFHGVAIGIFLIALIASESRGGFIGMVGAVLFCVLNSARKKQALIFLVIGALLVSIVAGPKYWEDMGTITDTKESTADMRLELWTIAWQMFLHNPLLGVGPGNYRWRIGDYQSAEQLEKFGRVLTESVVVHSTYFEILSELGIIGSALFAAILFRTLKDLRRIRSGVRSGDVGASNLRHGPISGHERHGPTDAQQLQYCSMAIMGSLIGYLLSAAFVSFTYYSHFWLLAALAAALNEVAKDGAGNPEAPSNPTKGEISMNARKSSSLVR